MRANLSTYEVTLGSLLGDGYRRQPRSEDAIGSDELFCCVLVHLLRGAIKMTMFSSAKRSRNPPRMRVTYDGLVDAFNSPDTPVTQAFIELFDSKSNTIFDALSLLDTVHWNDTIPPSPLREPAPTPAFDHHETEWTSRVSGYCTSPCRDSLALRWRSSSTRHPLWTMAATSNSGNPST